MRLVPSSDCDLLTAVYVDEVAVSLVALVFLIMTWHRGDFGPTVVALRIESLLATVP